MVPRVAAQDNALNVNTWGGSWTAAEETAYFKPFTEKTGIRINTVAPVSFAKLKAQVQTKNNEWDVSTINPTELRQAELEGLLEPIDWSVVNKASLGPSQVVSQGVGAVALATGIAYRKSALKKPPASWKDLFDDANLALLKGRISMLDDGRELAAAALLALGKAPNTRDEKEIAAARDLLLQQKASVEKYDSSSFGEALVAIETLVAQGWSGDIAKAQMEEPDIAFVVPEEGTLSYVDNWAIPRGAPHPRLAERFVDYMLRPDVAATLAKARLYATTNSAAMTLIPDEIRKGMAYDTGAAGTKLYAIEVLPDDVAKLYADAFAAMKAE